jgi:hypothetical protein
MDFLQSKKIIWVFVVIAIVAVGVAIVVGLLSKQQTTSDKSTKSGEFTVNKKDVAITKLPDKFPADLPMEKEAKVLQNYTSTTAAGGYQATREFETKKTLAENVKIYTDYLKKSGWTMGTGIDKTDFKVVSATKEDLSLQVTVQSLPSNVNTVTISLQQIK